MKFATLSTTIFASVIGALAESHTVRFGNKCGSGTPMLIQGPNVLSRGPDFTSNGPLTSAIAYLDNGNCGFNGEGCTLVELTLVNVAPGNAGSSVDISLIPPHKFSKATSFKYFNGCDGDGVSCANANCPNVFRKPDDTQVQIPCQVDNVDLEIDFC